MAAWSIRAKKHARKCDLLYNRKWYRAECNTMSESLLW